MKRPGPHPARVSQDTGHAELVDALVDLFVWAADLGLDPHELTEQALQRWEKAGSTAT
jgi:hypothetical protein